MNKTVQNFIDQICTQGCDAVWEVIGALKAGDNLEAFGDLSDEDKITVLKELTEIMAPYAEKKSRSS
jgi:hypothetical protein